MPLHPAPPTDLPTVVAGYAHTLRAVLELGRGCSEADFDRPTDCPGWSVKDQISHVVDLETLLAGDPRQQVAVPDLPHLRNDFGRFMEGGVQARRGIPGSIVVAQLEAVLPRRVAWWTDPKRTADTVVDSPLGSRTALGLARLRCLDIWCHEQDLRVALNRPGHLDSVAAQLFTQSIVDALPRIVARDAAVPIGYAVVFDITGPLVGRVGVRVVEGDSPAGEHAERGTGELLFSGASDRHGGGGPTTTITLSTEAFTRRGAGRWSVERTPHTVHGDADIAARVLDHLPVTP